MNPNPGEENLNKCVKNADSALSFPQRESVFYAGPAINQTFFCQTHFGQSLRRTRRGEDFCPQPQAQRRPPQA
jgi:hypothetical protein